MLTTCLSLAYKTTMLHGEVTYANVMKALETTKVSHDVEPYRLAAMVVQATKGAMTCRDGKFANVLVED